MSTGARLPRWLLAIVPPLAALILQQALGSFFQPSAWLLVYPAVFLSSWIGGLRAGVVASAASAAAVLWLFLPPERSFLKSPGEYLAAGVFFATGVLFGVFHDLWRRANRRTAGALAASERANEELREAARDRQIFAAFLENSSDFIGIAEPDGTPVYVNPAGRRMVGLAPDHPVKTTRIADYYPAAQRAFVSDVILKSMLETGHWQGETFFRHWRTGEAIPVSDTHFVIHDPKTGQVLGMGTVTREITEQRKHQEALREAQERFELALRGADLGAWDWNVESGEVVFNPRWVQMRGYAPEEVKGHVDSWISGVHPEDWPRVRKALDDSFQGRIPQYEAEHRVRTKSGQWIWVLDRGQVFARNERGEPLRMVGTELDITSWKRTEEGLRLAEAKASGIVSVSADAIITVDEAQRITLFNEGAERIFGYSKAEALGAPLEILIPERFRAGHRRHVERFAAGGEAARRMGERDREIFGRRKSGEEFPADAAISRLDVGGGRMLTVALRDVTEQKRMEREQKLLAEVGAVFAATLDYEETLSNIARLAVRDLADFCIVDVVEERELRRLTVVSRDPARGWICDLLAGIHLDRSRPYLTREVFDTRRPVLVEHLTPGAVASLAQGEEHLRALRALDPRSMILVPLLVHGRLLGGLALVSSTESRTFGPVDLHLGEEVAQRAALAIENARLYRTASRAIQARDDVLGIVAHDLRNPLGIILMQAALLRRPGEEPERRSRRPAEAIGRAARRMNRLIQDLLDVTRMEAGRLSIQRGWVPAAQVVSDSVDAQRALASSASIDLGGEVARALPDVWADRDRLLQVFENLIGNAVKFTGPGGRVTVGATAREGEVLFRVADTGEGIAAEAVPHVFDRFWQAGQASRTGAGLGLPIVKGLVEAHGGRVWAESTPGRGSTFFFTIPTAPRPGELAARNGPDGAAPLDSSAATAG